jgi:hypothetical protein
MMEKGKARTGNTTRCITYIQTGYLLNISRMHYTTVFSSVLVEKYVKVSVI